MRLLDRYLLRELLLPFGYSLAGFLVLWTGVNLFRDWDDIQEHALRAGDVLEFYAVKSPEFLVFLLPIALLLALLYTLSNHARYNEITAMRAAGVSLWRLAVPYLAVGCVASAVLFVLNEFLAPDSEEHVEQIMHRREGKKNLPDRNLVRNFGFSNARDRRTWQMAGYNLSTSEMDHPQVIWTLKDGSQRWLNAARAARTNGVWTFFDVREFRKPANQNELAPLPQVNVLAMPEFAETPDAIRSEVNISARLDRLNRGKISRPEVPIVEILDYLHFHPDLSRSDQRRWLFTVLHGRLATPWKCIVVVLIALPFGAASGRRNIVVGVASSIFICFAFYALQELSLALGTGGYVPAWVGGWLPNLVFGGVGLWMTARVR